MRAPPQNPDPRDLDAGIRATVLLLRGAGFQTFTSCEGGHGHAFRHPTIGLELEGDYYVFRDRLAAFLRAHGCRVFEVSLMTCYDEEHPEGRDRVYLEGIDLLSPEERKKALAAIKRQERRLVRQAKRASGQ
jgi:hypothetical protein